jgi:hypothetical protein
VTTPSARGFARADSFFDVFFDLAIPFTADEQDCLESSFFDIFTEIEMVRSGVKPPVLFPRSTATGCTYMDVTVRSPFEWASQTLIGNGAVNVAGDVSLAVKNVDFVSVTGNAVTATGITRANFIDNNFLSVVPALDTDLVKLEFKNSDGGDPNGERIFSNNHVTLHSSVTSIISGSVAFHIKDITAGPNSPAPNYITDTGDANGPAANNLIPFNEFTPALTFEITKNSVKKTATAGFANGLYLNDANYFTSAHAAWKLYDPLDTLLAEPGHRPFLRHISLLNTDMFNGPIAGERWITTVNPTSHTTLDLTDAPDVTETCNNLCAMTPFLNAVPTGPVTASQTAEILVEVKSDHPVPTEVVLEVTFRTDKQNYADSTNGESTSQYFPVVSRAQADFSSPCGTFGPACPQFNADSSYDAPIKTLNANNAGTGWLRDRWAFSRPQNPLPVLPALLEYKITTRPFLLSDMVHVTGSTYNLDLCGAFISSETPTTGTNNPAPGSNLIVNHYSCSTVTVTFSAQGSAFTSVQVSGTTASITSAVVVKSHISLVGQIQYTLQITSTNTAGSACMDSAAIAATNFVYVPSAPLNNDWSVFAPTTISGAGMSPCIQEVVVSKNVDLDVQTEITGPQDIEFTGHGTTFSVRVTLHLFRSATVTGSATVGIVPALFKGDGSPLGATPTFTFGDVFYARICSIDRTNYRISSPAVASHPLSCTISTSLVPPQLVYDPSRHSTTGCMYLQTIGAEVKTGTLQPDDTTLSGTPTAGNFNYRNNVPATEPTTDIPDANDCTVFKFDVRAWVTQTGFTTYLQIPVDTSYIGGGPAVPLATPTGTIHGGLSRHNGHSSSLPVNTAHADSPWVRRYKESFSKQKNGITIVIDKKNNKIHVETGGDSKGYHTAASSTVDIINVDSPYHLSFNGFNVQCAKDTLYAQTSDPFVANVRHECIKADKYTKLVDDRTGTVWYKPNEKNYHDDDDGYDHHHDHSSSDKWSTSDIVISVVAGVLVLVLFIFMLYYCCYKQYYGTRRRTKHRLSIHNVNYSTVPRANDYSSSDSYEPESQPVKRVVHHHHREVVINSRDRVADAPTFMMQQALKQQQKQ